MAALACLNKRSGLQVWKVKKMQMSDLFFHENIFQMTFHILWIIVSLKAKQTISGVVTWQ